MDKRALILGIYKRLSKKLGRAAKGPDLRSIGVTAKMVDYYFGSLTNLRNSSGFKSEKPELKAIYEALGVKNVK